MSDATAEGGGGAQGDQEVEGEGLPADGTASGGMSPCYGSEISLCGGNQWEN